MVEQSVKISIDQVLTKTCECSVCVQTFTDPHMTKCGHSFCKECITEVINRQHLCPECRAPAQLEELIKNFQLEALLKGLDQEIEQERQKFVNNLAD